MLITQIGSAFHLPFFAAIRPFSYFLPKVFRILPSADP